MPSFIRPVTITVNSVRYRLNRNVQSNQPDFLRAGDYTIRFYCQRNNCWSPVVGYILSCPRFGERRYYEAYSAAAFSLDDGFEQYIARSSTLRRVVSETDNYLRRLNL